MYIQDPEQTIVMMIGNIQDMCTKNFQKFVLVTIVCGQVFVLVQASHKKGLAVSPYRYKCHDLEAFSGIKWWYDWRQTASYHNKTYHCSNSLRIPRYPMVWGWRQHSDIPLYFHGQSEYVLGFNEPNFHQQSNLSPEVAAQHWREFQRIAVARGAKYLVSPAAAPGGDIHPTEWFDQFFQHCDGCKVDYIATHAYYCDPDTTMHYLESLWSRYNKKIWLTEFACPHTNSLTKQLDYMKGILPKLENAHFIDRYSWYANRVNSTTGWTRASGSLLQQHHSILTTLGRYYDGFHL